MPCCLIRNKKQYSNKKYLLLAISFLFLSALAIGQVPLKKDPLTSKKNHRFIFFPLIVKSPEYKWGGGMGGIHYFKLKQDSITRTSNNKLVSFFTLRKQLVVASEGTLYLPEERFIVHYTASISRFPDKFWGLGNDTKNAAQENYSISQYSIYPQLLREIIPHFFGGVGYEFQHVYQFDYNSNNGQSLFDQENIAGRYGSKISGAGFIITWDSRNNAFSSSKGFYFQYFSNFYAHWLGSQFNFRITNMDLRKYFDLHKQRVLAFQMNLISADGDIPVRDYSIMGSDSYMRGYYQGRYQDKNMFALQSEYRFPVYKRFGMTIFSGIGKVGASLRNALNFIGIKPSFGFGMRYAFNVKEKLNLRFDSGFGRKTHGSYINLGEAF